MRSSRRYFPHTSFNVIAGGVGTAGPMQSVTGGNAPYRIDNLIGVEDIYPTWMLKYTDSCNTGRVAYEAFRTSHTKMYRVAAAPQAATLYEALPHIGCRAAVGKPSPSSAPLPQQQQQIVDAIWAKFATKSVTRTNGQQLGYYRDGPCDQANDVVLAGELLKQTNGQCGSWADLFVRSLQAQGVSNVKMVRVEPIRTAVPDCVAGEEDWMGFLVNLYNFTGAGGSTCGNYPYRINAPCTPVASSWYWPFPDVTDGNGVGGQDSTDPASFFNRHFIVNHGDRFFDPSYGRGPFTGTTDQAALLWENASIAGYYGLGVATHQGQNVARHVARPGTAAREINFTLFDPLP